MKIIREANLKENVTTYREFLEAGDLPKKAKNVRAHIIGDSNGVTETILDNCKLLWEASSRFSLIAQCSKSSLETFIRDKDSVTADNKTITIHYSDGSFITLNL